MSLPPTYKAFWNPISPLFWPNPYFNAPPAYSRDEQEGPLELKIPYDRSGGSEATRFERTRIFDTQAQKFYGYRDPRIPPAAVSGEASDLADHPTKNKSGYKYDLKTDHIKFDYVVFQTIHLEIDWLDPTESNIQNINRVLNIVFFLELIPKAQLLFKLSQLKISPQVRRDLIEDVVTEVKTSSMNRFKRYAPKPDTADPHYLHKVVRNRIQRNYEAALNKDLWDWMEITDEVIDLAHSLFIFYFFTRSRGLGHSVNPENRSDKNIQRALGFLDEVSKSELPTESSISITSFSQHFKIMPLVLRELNKIKTFNESTSQNDLNGSTSDRSRVIAR